MRPRLARLVRRKAWTGAGKEQEQKKAAKTVARLSFMEGLRSEEKQGKSDTSQQARACVSVYGGAGIVGG